MNKLLDLCPSVLGHQLHSFMSVSSCFGSILIGCWSKALFLADAQAYQLGYQFQTALFCFGWAQEVSSGFYQKKKQWVLFVLVFSPFAFPGPWAVSCLFFFFVLFNKPYNETQMQLLKISTLTRLQLDYVTGSGLSQGLLGWSLY